MQQDDAGKRVEAPEQGRPGGLPSSWEPARWRCVTPVVQGGARTAEPDPSIPPEIGLAFNRPDGTVLRLYLPLAEGEALARSIGEYGDLYRSKTSQSPRSTGSPQRDVSTPSEFEKQ